MLTVEDANLFNSIEFGNSVKFPIVYCAHAYVPAYGITGINVGAIVCFIQIILQY